MKYRDIPTFSYIDTSFFPDKKDDEIIDLYRSSLQTLAEQALKSFQLTIQKLPEIENEKGYKDKFALSVISQMHTLLLSLTKKEYGLREENHELQNIQESFFEMIIESYIKKGREVPANVLDFVASKLIKYYDSISGESLRHYDRGERLDGAISQRQTPRAGEILGDFAGTLLDHKDYTSALGLVKTTMDHYAQSKAYNEKRVYFTYEDYDHTGYSCPTSYSITNPYPQKMPFLKQTFEIFLAKAPKDVQKQLIESAALFPHLAITDAMQVAKVMLTSPAQKVPQQQKPFTLKGILSVFREGGNSSKTIRG